MSSIKILHVDADSALWREKLHATNRVSVATDVRLSLKHYDANPTLQKMVAHIYRSKNCTSHKK